MVRNLLLSYRAPEGTNIGRATGFNKESVTKFYDALKTETETQRTAKNSKKEDIRSMTLLTKRLF